MISVIIPIFNAEDYLHVCLNSVLKQTYQNFEIICIDDCSTDSSLEILEYFSQKDSRIKVLKNDSNRGPGYSRNKGLDVACGKYVLFLDADDWFSLDAFEILSNISEKNNLDLLIFENMVYHDELQDFEINKNFIDRLENKIFNHFDLDKSDLFLMFNASWNKFYLKSFLDVNNIRFPNENIIHEDYPFFYNVLTSAVRISLINNCLYIKRQNSCSLLNSGFERIFDNISISYSILDVFQDNFQLYQYYKKELLNYIFNLLNTEYIQINHDLKENFFIEIQNVFKHFIRDYGLYNDILMNVNKSILDKFNFHEISKEVLSFKPKISLIIPIYNTEDFLESCLNSVTNQSMEDIEIICINDGSEDYSLDILNKFRNKDYRINIFSQKNKGVAFARNKGIEKANGEYILFVDSDDWINSTMCEELYNHAKHLDSDLVLFDATEHNLDNEYKNRIYFPGNSFNEDYDEFTFDYTFNKKLVLNHFFVVWSKMYKKDLVKKMKFPKLPLFEDVQFHVESMLLANKISYFPKLFYHYRKLNINSEQNFKVKTDKSLYLVDVFRDVYGILVENGRFEELQVNYLTFVLKESRNIFGKIGEEYKQLLFERINLLYNSVDINLDLLNEMPADLSKLYYNVINAKNYGEFNKLQEESNV